MLDVTDKERTLIDVVVRPAYACGIKQVADTYAKEVDKIDVDHLLDLLRRLDYAYPYHQAIGFLLERSGRPSSDYKKLKALGQEFDFYLDYGMERTAFNKMWRLHYPSSLD
jgi:predicted transcriptional regulator of viral defense system